jgi:hypothetical protein
MCDQSSATSRLAWGFVGSTPAASTSYVFILLDDLEVLAIDVSSSSCALV